MFYVLSPPFNTDVVRSLLFQAGTRSSSDSETVIDGRRKEEEKDPAPDYPHW